MVADAERSSMCDYALLDFGEGRKLERFGDFLLDRPSPAAEGSKRRDPAAWRGADLRFRKTRGDSGVWEGVADVTAWPATYSGMTFSIRPNASGNVGLFPEAAIVWDELRRAIGDRPAPVRLLNLFAYTGGASLACAAAGAEVAHVDSSATSVNVARENAAMSGLQGAAIRWIVDDARTFARRETRRGKTYDVVLLDPPTWGHGPKGQAWRFDDDLDELLDDVASLVRPTCGSVVLTGHAPGWDVARAKRHLRERLAPTEVRARALHLTTPDDRTLSAGWMATASFAPERSGDRGVA